MEEIINAKIENLKMWMSFKERERSVVHVNLLDLVNTCSSEAIARGRLQDDINRITMITGEIESIREQIALLESVISIQE